ncbi:MAG TPA: sensor histidine kinase N-terminal domain-containing protein [Pseudomonas sp.]|nr:sensor histidine kinase N-terminal domain-containing protein [Pseudomonas sp.]
MNRTGSLRGRLLRRLALLLTAILLLSSLSAYWSARRAADTAYDRTLLASARAIADGLHAGEGRLKANVPYVALDTFAYDSGGRIYYQVLDLQGDLVSGYEDLPAAPPGTPRTDDYPALARFYDADYRGQGVRLVSLLQPVSEPQLNGMAEIRVAETLGARERLARELLVGTLWRMGLLVGSALLLVWLAVSVALRPLDSLRRVVAERAGDDLRPLPEAELPRELRPLVRALNRFNGRLHGLFERQAQFIADAAHELRTPLAVLRIHAHNALEAEDPSDRAEALRQLGVGVERATRVVAQLLTLARLDPSVLQLAMVELDLLGFVRNELAELIPLALDHDQELTLEADERGDHRLRADGPSLGILLQNLVSNAVQFTPTGGSIQVSLEAQEHALLLRVQDSGPGVEPARRERLFERFYRQNDSQGAGLGLSIVWRIVELHRGSISLGDSPLGGLEVCVRLPR